MVRTSHFSITFPPEVPPSPERRGRRLDMISIRLGNGESTRVHLPFQAVRGVVLEVLSEVIFSPVRFCVGGWEILL